MIARVFYSWQSDVRAAACRTLIQDALEASVHAMIADGAVEVMPVIDRDTLNVPGAPDIGNTILSKIKSADAFVADVTIVGTISGKRPTPNPNVLVEVGYALHARGEGRVVLVQNTAFGTPESLPFDLRQKRVLQFASSEADAERSVPRRQLVTALKTALTSILSAPREPTASGDDRAARWRDLLSRTLAEHNWVEFESALEHDLGVIDGSGRSTRVPAPLDGFVNVRSVGPHEFALGFPLRGQSSISVITIPFGQVEDIWPGTEGRLHVLLKRALVFKDGTSRFA
jgi:hypothetical protein